jgi:hypothetical protein
MDDEACQSCHQRQFTSFAGDHPDFGVWPYERRTRIAFNHASHEAKHFAEQKKTFDCRSCHTESASGDVQLVASYEATCAVCHDEKIATSVAHGIPVFSLPTLDVDAMRAAKHDIDAWPQGATGDFDGRLSPMMKLLLAADPAAAKALDTLGPDFEFLDVDPNDGEQVAAAAVLTTATRTMLVDVARRGPVAVRERLAAATGAAVSKQQVNALVAGMPVDSLRGAVGTWFAGVDVGNGAWDNAIADGESVRSRNEVAYEPSGTWFRDDATFAVRYRPSGHADPVLAAWLQLAVDGANATDTPLARAMLKELSSPTAAGLCASCHSVERSQEGKLAINWRAFDRTTAPRPFTKFAHEPHLLLPQLADCTACHAVSKSAATATGYSDFDPRQFVSDFRPIAKGQCAQCHTAKAAGERCQSCHNYHVEAGDWELGSETKPFATTQADNPLRISDF